MAGGRLVAGAKVPRALGQPRQGNPRSHEETCGPGSEYQCLGRSQDGSGGSAPGRLHRWRRHVIVRLIPETPERPVWPVRVVDVSLVIEEPARGWAGPGQ